MAIEKQILTLNNYINNFLNNPPVAFPAVLLAMCLHMVAVTDDVHDLARPYSGVPSVEKYTHLVKGG